MDDDTWTIAELADRAAAVLAADTSAQASGRVRDLPNERLIRWYTTIGLIDPPLGRRGRTALYGPRHLLQLVAVKRRQASGRSIAEIQVELAAATDADLARIAAIPHPPDTRSTYPPAPSASLGRTAMHPGSNAPATREADRAPLGDSPAGPQSQGTAAEGAEGGDRGNFWSTRPDVSFRRDIDLSGYGELRPAIVQGVRLAPGLTVLLEVPDLNGDDLAAIEAAARPLLDELRRRGLLAPVRNPAESPDFQPADPPRRIQ
ncbi:MerR family transcriptional regulator [Actinomadura mexicana]|uniref:MerR HTH family regulatory protein n=1 Tax=Actinomadura mexicana TaxID=134959 RepID=A0A239H724_9ACTN|nr:MerR family transcriptional regulator [Actinomadura mexicana]SNS77177.1 MerR HTH family regulatory protein [Actinomadura mexicana]